MAAHPAVWGAGAFSGAPPPLPLPFTPWNSSLFAKAVASPLHMSAHLPPHLRCSRPAQLRDVVPASSPAMKRPFSLKSPCRRCTASTCSRASSQPRRWTPSTARARRCCRRALTPLAARASCACGRARPRCTRARRRCGPSCADSPTRRWRTCGAFKTCWRGRAGPAPCLW